MNKSKIDRELFSNYGDALDSHSHCPLCHGKLEIRYGKHGAFFGCINYPECHYIQPLQQNDGHVIKRLGVPCPECENELLLRQGKFGMFIGCSHYPECHHIESIDKKDDSECDTESFVCPECKQGHLVERKSRFGKAFWACDQYPKCKFALNYHPKNGQCEKCGYPILFEKTFASGKKIICANRACGHHQLK